MRTQGPYIYPSGACAGRRYVIVIHDDGSKRQLLYSRHLMEQHLGRQLGRDEHVHHVNEDKTDDRLENLQVESLSDHSRHHSTGRISPMKGVEKGWRHGTMYGWMKKKCSCDPCTTAKRSWHEARNASRRKQA